VGQWQGENLQNAETSSRYTIDASQGEFSPPKACQKWKGKSIGRILLQIQHTNPPNEEHQI